MIDAAFSEKLSKILDDAAGVADGLRQEADGFLRARVEKLSQELNTVPREEFEVVRDMAIAARAENAKLAKRIAVLEKRLSARKVRPLRRKKGHYL